MTGSDHRIIVTGHPGVQKTSVIARLRQYILEQDDEWRKLRDADVPAKLLQREQELVAWAEGEAELKKAEDQFRGGFLYTHDPKARYDKWALSLANALDCLDRSKARTKFLILNASFYSFSQFWTPLFWPFASKKDPWQLLSKFKPTQFINLYDNLYFTRERIREPYQLSPAELLHWRNIELFNTDALASRLVPLAKRKRRRENADQESLSGRYPFDRSTYFAVGHPPETLYKLLFDENCLRVYLSFPISEPKKQFAEAPEAGKLLMDQIDEFRRYMSHHFVAFDPLTIDELPLKFAFASASAAQSEIVLDTSVERRQVWPIAYPDALGGEQMQRKIKFSRHELESVCSDKPQVKNVTGSPLGSELDNQVASRDFRLIDQADGVIVYRPGLMKDIWGVGGTRAEFQHASNQTRRKPVVVIHDRADGDLNKPPLLIDVDELNVVRSDQDNDFDDPAKRNAAFDKAKTRMDVLLRQNDWLR